jgi:hypothetical protein
MKSPDPKTAPKAAPTSSGKEAREQRLARALRDNLRRRKAAESPGQPKENGD